MGPYPIVELFKLFVVAALVLWFWHRIRGGRPPTPMHPSPADDAVLLRKRRSRSKAQKFSGSGRISGSRMFFVNAF
jgi:hypothetical protein